jgi:hypothetical protein
MGRIIHRSVSCVQPPEGQAVRVLLHDANGAIAVGLVDADAMLLARAPVVVPIEDNGEIIDRSRVASRWVTERRSCKNSCPTPRQ